MVPIPPSRTTMRCSSASRSALRRSAAWDIGWDEFLYFSGADGRRGKTPSAGGKRGSRKSPAAALSDGRGAVLGGSLDGVDFDGGRGDGGENWLCFVERMRDGGGE